ncbi:MAG: hypothetical protein L0Y45_01375 [Woeseiaceae bacterium]|nr:hypothetical protein [Woeseiaceae bacterium]
MKSTPAKRGRPRKNEALTAAERMRSFRQRRRAAGYKDVRQWQLNRAQEPLASSDHRILDARSLAMHCKIARRIDANPALLEVPKRNLERWSKNKAAPMAVYLREWQQILDKPWPEVAAFITSFSEDAVRLRQSSPFAGILTPKDRKQIYDAFGA